MEGFGRGENSALEKIEKGMSMSSADDHELKSRDGKNERPSTGFQGAAARGTLDFEVGTDQGDWKSHGVKEHSWASERKNQPGKEGTEKTS